MSSAAPSPTVPPRSLWSRWRFVFAPRWLAWHAFAVVAVGGMLWLGDWQLHRALGGNALSWAYTFEWPLFAGFGVVFWAKTILDEGKPAGARAAAAKPAAAPVGVSLDLPGTGGRSPAADGGPAEDETPDDPDLDQYNAYLQRLNRQPQSSGWSRRPR